MVFATQMEGMDKDLDQFCKADVDEAFAGLDWVDLNVVLFRSDGEEKDATGKYHNLRWLSQAMAERIITVLRRRDRDVRRTRSWPAGILWTGGLDGAIETDHEVQRSGPWSVWTPARRNMGDGLRAFTAREVGLRII